MNKNYSFLLKTIVSFTFLLASQMPAWSDSISFVYDAAGNRIERYIDMTPPEMRSDEAVEDSASAAESSSQQMQKQAISAPNEPLKDFALANAIRIYPNPTEGLLKVEIDNLQEHQKASITLMSIQGQTIVNQSKAQISNELDISARPAGTYIMRITLDGKSTEWKIIKK